MYTMVVLYLGGIIILFMYICRISSVSKIERNSLTQFFIVAIVAFVMYNLFPFLGSFSFLNKLNSAYSLYSSSRQIILIILRIYLILGLLARIFFIEKLEGPLKSFYVK